MWINEIEKINLRSHRKAYENCSVFINSKFCIIALTTHSFLQRLPVIITADADTVKQFSFLGCFTILAVEEQLNNCLRIKIRNKKLAAHTKEFFFQRLTISDIEMLTTTLRKMG